MRMAFGNLSVGATIVAPPFRPAARPSRCGLTLIHIQNCTVCTERSLVQVHCGKIGKMTAPGQARSGRQGRASRSMRWRLPCARKRPAQPIGATAGGPVDGAMSGGSGSRKRCSPDFRCDPKQVPAEDQAEIIVGIAEPYQPLDDTFDALRRDHPHAFSIAQFGGEG